jgi:hypothetical protein
MTRKPQDCEINDFELHPKRLPDVIDAAACGDIAEPLAAEVFVQPEPCPPEREPPVDIPLPLIVGNDLTELDCPHDTKLGSVGDAVSIAADTIKEQINFPALTNITGNQLTYIASLTEQERGTLLSELLDADPEIAAIVNLTGLSVAQAEELIQLAKDAKELVNAVADAQAFERLICVFENEEQEAECSGNALTNDDKTWLDPLYQDMVENPVSVPAGTFTSAESQEDANALAADAAARDLRCLYPNTAQTAYCVTPYQRDYEGMEFISDNDNVDDTLDHQQRVGWYTVPANTVFSTASVAEANIVALTLAENALVCFYPNEEFTITCAGEGLITGSAISLDIRRVAVAALASSFDAVRIGGDESNYILVTTSETFDDEASQEELGDLVGTLCAQAYRIRIEGSAEENFQLDIIGNSSPSWELITSGDFGTKLSVSVVGAPTGDVDYFLAGLDSLGVITVLEDEYPADGPAAGDILGEATGQEILVPAGLVTSQEDTEDANAIARDMALDLLDCWVCNDPMTAACPTVEYLDKNGDPQEREPWSQSPLLEVEITACTVKTSGSIAEGDDLNSVKAEANDVAYEMALSQLQCMYCNPEVPGTCLPEGVGPVILPPYTAYDSETWSMDATPGIVADTFCCPNEAGAQSCYEIASNIGSTTIPALINLAGCRYGNDPAAGDCGAINAYGGSVTVPANMFFVSTSEEVGPTEAKEQANDLAQAFVGALLVCYWLNTEITVECAAPDGTIFPPQAPSSVTMGAGKIVSFSSQDDANNIAEILARAQLICLYCNAYRKCGIVYNNTCCPKDTITVHEGVAQQCMILSATSTAEATRFAEELVAAMTICVEPIAVQGPPGPPGAKGDKGDDGDPGEDGWDGADGAQTDCEGQCSAYYS